MKVEYVETELDTIWRKALNIAVREGIGNAKGFIGENVSIGKIGKGTADKMMADCFDAFRRGHL